MKEKYGSNFLIGLLFGSLVVLLFWYYQKSTSAEDGALALLDRLAEAQARLRALQDERRAADGGRVTAVPVPSAAPPQAQDDLTRVKGIGPVFASRLQGANITSIAQLASLPAAQVMEILQVPEGRAVDILAAAQSALM